VISARRRSGSRRHSVPRLSGSPRSPRGRTPGDRVGATSGRDAPPVALDLIADAIIVGKLAVPIAATFLTRDQRHVGVRDSLADRGQ
jgi:hypothetical protein